jgi:hypothetical protein
LIIDFAMLSGIGFCDQGTGALAKQPHDGKNQLPQAAATAATPAQAHLAHDGRNERTADK